MIARGRVKRLEAAWRPRRTVTPGFDLDALTEAEVRYMLALSEKDGALTEEERAAVAAIDEKAKAVNL